MRWQDATVADVEFSVRTTNALQAWRYGITLGEIDKMPDLDLLRLPNFGRKSLREVREVISGLREGRQRDDTDIILWVMEHRHLVRALMNGEAEIRLTKQDQ